MILQRINKDYSDEKYDSNDRDPLTGKIIAACCQVHNEPEPGFIERVYLAAL